MKNKDWKQAQTYVLENYPKAVCFKYKKGSAFAIFSDRDMIEAKRLSKNPFEGKTADTKAMAWLEAEEKIREVNKVKQITVKRIKI
ncbi:hypothetical protein [Tenacibaculum piscium]|uniref:hypothetical protein n=1 Tax=Tenacibaculum piscium TaxID=1458515 RepID=UPI001F22A2CF|nr:hypothetical protein [Tenacibaculum piscium]